MSSYAERAGEAVSQAEQWLSHVLVYNPASRAQTPAVHPAQAPNGAELVPGTKPLQRPPWATACCDGNC